MAEDWKPERTYHDRNDPEEWPDSNRVLKGGFIRAFWTVGQQMWDEDLNNNFAWFKAWINRAVFWRQEPRAPYFAPYRQQFIADPKWCSLPIADTDPNRIVDISIGDTKQYNPWLGVTTFAAADRQVVGFAKNAGGHVEWRGWNSYAEYVDYMEIAIFMSETRRGEIVATHRVMQSFILRATSKSSRLRGWTYKYGGLEILKNGTKVGELRQGFYGSGLVMTVDTTFAPGDRMEIRAPVIGPYLMKSVSATIVAELP